ncbi:MAG: 2-aminoethylphosphonate--pyruvate transaminase [Turicibacter sp.]|nr:2-aminoethylphosphonate--pyruvate transaminase [Turicibacter sp.]
MATNIKAVIFDWAGTTVDYGCFAPVKGFIDGYKNIGIEITNEMARKPMGMLKMDHTREIAKMLDQEITEEQIQAVYKDFERILFSNIENHCDVKDHIIETVAYLKAQGIRVGSTTGYTSEMMARVLPKAAENGYAPEFWTSPDQVGKGRPAPYMIWENMKEFGLTDPREIIKVGDTVSDILEGTSANTWTVGVVMGSSELGLTRKEVAALSADELEAKKAVVRQTYYKAGADFIIDGMDELPSVIAQINAKLKQNAAHLLLTPGPLTTRDSVKHAMLTDHCTWDDEYKEITTGVLNDITNLSANDDYATVLLQGSGSYAVEAMINCLCKPEEKILFLVNGEYGKRMLQIAKDSKHSFDVLTFDEQKAACPKKLAEKLEQDKEIKTVVFVHCETTTGLLNPIEALVKTAKSFGKTVLVDAMSSFGAYDIDMVGWDIDALASSANKCLEGLPGLAFIIAKKTLIEASKGNSASHSLDVYDQYQGLYAGGGKFRFTSPTNILLALAQAIEEYKKEGGLAGRMGRYMANHRTLTEGLAKLGINPIVDPSEQSHIITTFELGNMDFKTLYDHLKTKGFIIYPGKLTALPTFRIGNIGNVFPEDMLNLVNAFEAYLGESSANGFMDKIESQLEATHSKIA